MSINVEIVDSRGNKRNLTLVEYICRDTNLCLNQTSQYYEVFNRSRPLGLESLENQYQKQYQHPFSAAYLCKDSSLVNQRCLLNTIQEFVVTLKNATVDWTCVVETPEYRIHDALALETSTWPMLPEWGIDRNNRRVVRFSKVAMTISRWSFSYYHFMTEALWRIIQFVPTLHRDWRNYLKNRFGNTSYQGLKVMSYNMSFSRQCLEILQIQPEQIIWGPVTSLSWEPDNLPIILEVDQLSYPSASLMVAPSRRRLANIRDRMTYYNRKFSHGSSKSQNQPNDLMIYLSRVGERARNIQNEQLICQILLEFYPNLNLVVLGKTNDRIVGQQWGRQIQYLSVGNVSRTINLIRRAKVIMGPHGAGLSNILWARPNTTVIELLPSSSSTLIYWHLAESLNLRYWFILLPESHWGSYEMQLPPELLRQTLSHINGQKIDNQLCPPGTYLKRDICLLCPPGTYNDNLTLSDNCQDCPNGETTRFPNFPMNFLPEQSVDLTFKYGSDHREDCQPATAHRLIKRQIDACYNCGYDKYYQGYYY